MEQDRREVKLIGEGLLVGLAGGLLVVAFRYCLEHAEKWMKAILADITGNPFYMALWILALILMAVIVSLLIKWEPDAAGSGIPQMEAEHQEKIDQSWWRVILAKFSSCVLCVFGGLALGRGGPSVQLGAMAGKGVSKVLKRDKEEEEILKTCGASAGLAAVFHAPLAGAIYSLEQVHKNFSLIVFLPALAAAVAADLLVALFLGTDTIFQLGAVEEIPIHYYLLLLILGVILGLIAAFYDWIVLKVKSWYDNAKKVPDTIKIMIPFLCAGLLGFIHPDLLGSGHSLIDELTGTEMALSFMIIVILVRILFFAVSFGSGAPGGIFFPLLMLGAYIGGVFATICIQNFGVDTSFFNTFIILAMGGFFAAVVRTPLTGIVLLFELTGSFSQLLPLAFISLVAYAVAKLVKPVSISDQLREGLIAKREAKQQKADNKEAEQG